MIFRDSVSPITNTVIQVPSGDNEVTLDNENDRRTVAYHTRVRVGVMPIYLSLSFL